MKEQYWPYINLLICDGDQECFYRVGLYMLTIVAIRALYHVIVEQFIPWVWYSCCATSCKCCSVLVCCNMGCLPWCCVKCYKAKPAMVVIEKEPSAPAENKGEASLASTPTRAMHKNPNVRSPTSPPLKSANSSEVLPPHLVTSALRNTPTYVQQMSNRQFADVMSSEKKPRSMMSYLGSPGSPKASKSFYNEENVEEKREASTLEETFEVLATGETDSSLDNYPLQYDHHQSSLWLYMKLTAFFGYVFIFSASVPGIAVIALLVLIADVRGRAWRFCTLYERGVPYDTSYVEVWEQILDLITIASVLTNAGIIAFTLKEFDNWIFVYKLCLYIGIVLGLACYKYVLYLYSHGTPREVKIQRERSKAIIEKLIEKRAEGRGDFHFDML